MKRVIVLTLLLLSTSILYSHPHVFIDINIEVLNTDTAEISWTFDPIESANKLYFFDDNQDGLLSDKEIKNLYNEGFNSLKEFHYFITIGSGDEQYGINEIYNFTVVIENDKRLTLKFDIKLPPFPEENRISITHFDTSYFISFSDPASKNIKVGQSLYFTTFKNKEKPYYYDPSAGRSVILDTSTPKRGWLMAYPTEVYISTKPILESFGDYKISIREIINQSQRFVYIKLSEKLILIKKSRSISIILSILLLSFIYGVIHAVGPGHRKIIISSYILSKPTYSYIKSIGISMFSALIHSGMGIVSILFLYLLFDKVKPVFIDNITTYTQTISFIGVFLLALVLIILKMIKSIKKSKDSLKESNKPISLSVIILSSLVPCPGAITIMLFSLSFGMIILGIITVLAMSIGIGITLSIISLVTLKGKNMIYSINENKFKMFAMIFEWSGLIILLLFSIFMISSINY